MPLYNGGRIGLNNKPFTGTKSDDPNYSNVSLLLNGNGTNGSTTFTDSSSYGHTVTANGNAQISTAQSKFGGASMYFDGSGDTLTIPGSPEFSFDGDFTVEFWCYPTNTSTNNQYFIEIGSSSNGLIIRYRSNTYSDDIYVQNTNPIYITPEINANQWNHIALTRSGNTVRAFVDGVVDTQTLTVSGTVNTANAGITIGRGDFANSYEGYIDDLRITKGIARYTSNFTPPTAQLPGGETGTFASGLWTLEEQSVAIRKELWPGFIPGIVTDGLVLNLDAGDSNSYPGSGSTWYDLSGNGNNGTLVNGVGYNSDNGGSLVFDGNDDYVDLGTITTSNPLQMNNSSGGGLTISWWGIYDGSGDDFQRIFDKSSGGTGTNGWAIYSNLVSTPTIYLASNGSDVQVSTTQVGSTGTWENWCITWSSTTNAWVVYLNGSQDNSGTRTWDIPSVQTNARIGSWNHSTGREYNGKLSNMLIYDKVLTPTEITQNFNALKGRYGL